MSLSLMVSMVFSFVLGASTILILWLLFGHRRLVKPKLEPQDENAMMREHISDLAARLTALAAKLEGEDSPIYKILSDDIKGGKGGEKGGEAVSLGDRIRLLAESDEKKN